MVGVPSNSAGVLATLLKAQADINWSVHGRTPLYMAVAAGDAASARVLVRAKACVATAHRAARARHGSLLAAAVASSSAGHGATAHHRVADLVRFLVRKCPWLVRDAPVCAAAQLEQPGVLQALLDAKAAPDGETSSTPLCCAVRSERLHNVRLLAARGAAVLGPHRATSPVHVAFQRSYVEGLRVLLPYVDAPALRTDCCTGLPRPAKPTLCACS